GTPGRKATGLAEVRLTLLDPEAKALAESAAAALPSNSPAADAAISGSAGDDAHSDAFPQSYGAGSNGRSNGTNGAAHSAGAQAQANGNSRGQAHFSTAEAIRQAGVITVTRRLFASGESEYLLNDRVCRLRDIQDLFLG